MPDDARCDTEFRGCDVKNWWAQKRATVLKTTHRKRRLPQRMSDPTLLVLASLADGDKHGYAMVEDIRAFAGIRLGPGTLYGAITRLEERGWIRALTSSDRRRPYRLTPDGRRHLQEQLAGLDQIVKAGRRRLKLT
jgi:DNA-binding PadR family transcriptional regulator